MRWSTLSRGTRVAAILGATLALLLLGPIAVALVMLRCCDATRGADAGAWVVIGLLLVVIALVASFVAGGLAELVRRMSPSRSPRA